GFLYDHGERGVQRSLRHRGVRYLQLYRGVGAHMVAAGAGLLVLLGRPVH
ncbi:unnamed protein product, partial [Prorocentrum cordatum]